MGTPDPTSDSSTSHRQRGDSATGLISSTPELGNERQSRLGGLDTVILSFSSPLFSTLLSRKEISNLVSLESPGLPFRPISVGFLVETGDRRALSFPSNGDPSSESRGEEGGGRRFRRTTRDWVRLRGSTGTTVEGSSLRRGDCNCTDPESHTTLHPSTPS